MKISITYKHVESHQSAEVEIPKHVRKLETLLKSYSPDLIQLHGVFDQNSRTIEYSCALTLFLPGGSMHATGQAKRVATSCKRAFAELESQLKKRQAKLRRDYEWKRKRPRPRASQSVEAAAAS